LKIGHLWYSNALLAKTLNLFVLKILCFSHGGKGDKPVDLVLSCVDNFEARMAINTVRGLFFILNNI